MLNFTVVEGMSPSVIGGMSLLREFGIMLMKTAETEAENSFICSIEAKFGRKITDEERFRRTTNILNAKNNSSLFNLLSDNKGVFMADNWDIGKSIGVKHHIRTTGEPINMKPRRQPVNLEDKIEAAIQNLWIMILSGNVAHLGTLHQFVYGKKRKKISDYVWIFGN